MESSQVILRPAEPADDRALERLSQLEGRRTPGPHLLAFRGGDAQAALCLRTGELLADPFRPTADLCRLLELQAKLCHMRSRVRRRRALPIRSRALAGT